MYFLSQKQQGLILQKITILVLSFSVVPQLALSVIFTVFFYGISFFFFVDHITRGGVLNGKRIGVFLFLYGKCFRGKVKRGKCLVL